MEGAFSGEWLIFGLARSEADVLQTYYDDYYKRVEADVKACKGQLIKGNTPSILD